MGLFYELPLGSWDQSRRGELFRSETLTVLPVQQNLKTVGLVVVECLSHLLGGLLVSQLSVHETERKQSGRRSRTFRRAFRASAQAASAPEALQDSLYIQTRKDQHLINNSGGPTDENCDIFHIYVDFV